MSALSLEDQNFVERQTELIAMHDPGEHFVGEIILQVRPSLFRDQLRDPDLLPPLSRITGIQGIGQHEPSGEGRGIGVMGVGDGQRQGGIGVLGQGSTGVRGETSGAFREDVGIGVLGEGFDHGEGVHGHSQSFDGVAGTSDAKDKSGVFGFNSQDGESGSGSGVTGSCNAPGGVGVSGESVQGVGVRGHSRANDGVVGLCDGNGKSGVFGFNSKTKGVAFGVVGRCESNQGVGVDGGNGSSGIGVRGVCDNPGGVGVQGKSKAGVGVQGTSDEGVGVVASSENNDAVFASAEKGNGVIAVSDGSGNGVVAFSNFGNAILAMVPSRPSGKIIPTGGTGRFAGRFVGPVLIEGIQQVLLDQIVLGNLVVLGSKSAAVSHPDGSHRLLYSLESPESWFEDFGEGKLVNGYAEVTLNPDFAAVIKTNRYHVFVTPYGNSSGLYVTHRNSKGFRVQEQNGGKNSLPFSYRVAAKRKGIKAERLARITLPEHPISKVPKRPDKPSIKSWIR